MNKNFICASREMCGYDKYVAAPLFRKSFIIDDIPDKAELSICGLGFYILKINGVDITKGMLAPYISNPDHYLYYDTYDVAPYLKKGENVIGIILGNGNMNPFGGEVWDFDKVAWRGAPRVSLEFCASIKGQLLRFEADESFLTHPSPILFDEFRSGEIYDAREEINGWDMPSFNAYGWQNAMRAEAPRGELRMCDTEPIRIIRQREPISIIPHGEGFLYDFGVNSAGVCRLKIKARAGQRITMRYCERLKDGKFSDSNLRFSTKQFPRYNEFVQKTIYTAKGDDEEIWMPSFVYFGFRYVLVEGIDADQVTNELLTYLVTHSDISVIGGFECSDERANRLFAMARNSDMSNFHYFPVDCPHREKHGWTGDASMSANHMVLQYDVEKSFCEWLRNIRKAQNDVGALPGIVPTGGWGYKWGNGPVFDSILFNYPYVLYRYRGNTDVIRENAHAMVRYLEYIISKRSPNGTVEIGLGDWVPVGKNPDQYTVPVGVCNTIMVMDMAGKAAEMFNAIGYGHMAVLAENIRRDMRDTVRRVYLDSDSCTLGNTSQSGQAMGLYYCVFEPEEKQKAVEALVNCIHENGDSFDCGFVGMHCIFNALCDGGEAELAWHMITKSEYPSFGHFLDIGDTSIPEQFHPDGINDDYYSRNHHFLCDYSRTFMSCIAGLKVIDSKNVQISPCFISSLSFAEAYHNLPRGRVSVRWQRTENGINVFLKLPVGVQYSAELSEEACLEVEYIGE